MSAAVEGPPGAAIPPADPSSTLAAAVAFRDRGWRPFPLDHPALTVCASAHIKVPCDGKRGKHPAGGWATMTANSPADGMLARWFEKPRNIGIGCAGSKLLIVDDDTDTFEQWCAEQGYELPPTYRVRTARGWHYYFTDEAREFGNTTGALPEHIDIRGARGGPKDAGGYVVGAGSRHASGVEYLAEDPWADVVAVPEFLKELLRAPRPGAEKGSSTSQDGWTDEPRYGTREQLLAQYTRHLKAVRTKGGNFRHELFNAARDGWRCVDLEILERKLFIRALEQAIARVWDGAEPDDNDENIVFTEARNAATASPWVLLDPPRSADAGSEDGASVTDDEPETPEQEHAAAVALTLKRLRATREAKAILAVEDREPLLTLDWAEFLDSPQPEYLVPDMLYRDGSAKVFGPPGSTKSFLVLDLALSLATGTPWHGIELEQARVHYVMAEGQAINVGRTLTWLHHHGLPRDAADGWFRAVPQGVLLTEQGVAAYLEVVQDEAPELVILDTKNRMMVGEENSGTDAAVMIRAIDSIRKTAGRGCVLLVDHTGVHDTTRGRGSNAVEGAMDTEIRVTAENGVATAEVTRDKDSESGTRWFYRLEKVPAARRPGAKKDPVVPVPIDEPTSVVFSSGARWWDMDQEPLPEKLAMCTDKGHQAARDVFRILRFVKDKDGITRGQINAALAEAAAAGYRTHGTSSVTAGCALLAFLEVADKPSVGRYAIAPHVIQ